MCRKASTLSNQAISPSCPKTISFYHADSYGTNVAKDSDASKARSKRLS